MIIDSHHHFWDYDEKEYAWISADMAVLRRSYLPADLKKSIAATGVDAVVSVQARQTIEETHWLLKLAAEWEFVKGVVGWAPLIAPRLGDVLDRLQGNPELKALRHVLQDEQDDNYMLRDDFNRGISRLHEFGLAYDILIFQKHLPQTLTFVDRHPNQVFILDHVAKPLIESSTPAPEWEMPIRELARRENVFCKISGMVTEVRPRDWTSDLLLPYVDVVLDAFGPQRLMFGSDWPVCLLRAEYGKWFETVQDFTKKLSEDERASIMGDTATVAYGL